MVAELLNTSWVCTNAASTTDDLKYWPEAMKREDFLACPVSQTVADKVTVIEEFDISADRLASSIKDLITQGNIQRIIIQNAERCTLVRIPIINNVVSIIRTLDTYPEAYAIEIVAAVVPLPHLIIERQGNLS